MGTITVRDVPQAQKQVSVRLFRYAQSLRAGSHPRFARVRNDGSFGTKNGRSKAFHLSCAAERGAVYII
jgi:hypothetical protein